MREALVGTGTQLEDFQRELCVWSFEQGFSKPDPHVFQILVTRLEVCGISPAQTVVVGDRLDNDIEPARARGMQTWHLAPTESPGGKTGLWGQLAAQLQHSW